MTGAALLLRIAGGLPAALDGAAGAAAGLPLYIRDYFLSRGRMGDWRRGADCSASALYGPEARRRRALYRLMAGGVAALVLLAAKRVTRKSAVPLGPFLCAGCAAAMLFGGKLTEYFGFTVPWPWTV